jgi:hypothetical protein
MKISLFNKFGALNSIPVFSAFQQGLESMNLNYNFHDMSADVAVIWSMVWAGRMQSNQTVWQQFRSSGRPVIVLEVGMLNRGHTWKIGLNGISKGCYYDKDLDTNRPSDLGIELMPWKQSGQNIVIAVQRHDSEQWHGQPSINTWLNDTVSTVRKYTDRPIAVRSHPRQPVSIPTGCIREMPSKIEGSYDSYNFAESLSNTWAVINHNSGPGSQSVIAGVPAFVSADSLAVPVACTDLKQIENPLRPDRSQWIVEVCHTEWTLAEIADGRPLERLLVGLAQ